MFDFYINLETVKMKNIRVGVIMAGGSGERFWPLSRRTFPKQFLKLANSSKSLLQQSIERLQGIIAHKNIFIVTGEHLKDAIKAENLPIPAENIIIEPCKRNTMGCIIYATAYILAKYGCDESELTVNILPADHTIKPILAFQNTVSYALSVAENSDSLVTIGIVPDRVATGYGYVEIAKKQQNKLNGSNNIVYKVSCFHEKPDFFTAESFIKQGNFYWNGGMFFWKVSSFLAELQLVNSNYYDCYNNIFSMLKSGDVSSATEFFRQLPCISIDYALLEKSDNILLVPAIFEWDDIGAWDALERTMEGDKDGNITIGNPILCDVKNSIVYNEVGADKLAVAVIGMSDIIVVTTKDGIVILPKSQAQKIRDVVAKLKSKNATQL